MKKSLSLIICSLLLTSSMSVEAFDKNDSYEDVIKKIKTIDCAKDAMECRYFSAIEYVSFVKQCPLAFEYKFKTHEGLDQFNERVKNDLENWQAISEPHMHEAVLSDNNHFRTGLEKKILAYLKTVPADDLAIECSRIALIEQNKDPENMSDILKGTLNYNVWQKKMDEKNQKDFTDTQEKLKPN